MQSLWLGGVEQLPCQFVMFCFEFQILKNDRFFLFRLFSVWNGKETAALFFNYQTFFSLHFEAVNVVYYIRFFFSILNL